VPETDEITKVRESVSAKVLAPVAAVVVGEALETVRPVKPVTGVPLMSISMSNDGVLEPLV
jgi:hypothetical protein